MQHYDLIIFDADGTLRECTIPGQPCPNQPDEWRLIPGVIERLAEIDWERTKFGIASNQAGCAFGFMSEDDALMLLQDLCFSLRERVRLPVGQLRMCPHAPNTDCDCRKPAPEMLLDIMRSCNVPAAHTLYVGDMESDRQAAANAGIDFQWAQEFFRR